MTGARAYTTTRSSERVRGLLCAGARDRLPKLPRDPKQLIRLQTVSREIPLLNYNTNTWQKGGKRFSSSFLSKKKTNIEIFDFEESISDEKKIFVKLIWSNTNLKNSILK